jgi:hypothetical protein
MMIEQKIKSLPIKSYRMNGVKGITAKVKTVDPAINIDGLPNPFSVYFSFFVSNLHTETIYVTALLVNPPSGWTDSEQNLYSVQSGYFGFLVKSNSRRSTPTVPSVENVTLRINYRTGSYTGPIIGYDDFVITIYWESVSNGGIIDDIDDFEEDFEGWNLVVEEGTCDMQRTTSNAKHGSYSLRVSANAGSSCYITKTINIGSGSRAYLFGYIQTFNNLHHYISIITPVEVSYACWGVTAYYSCRFGVRLNPNSQNTVTIRLINYMTSHTIGFYLDYLKFVRFGGG